uniref:Prolyl 4-hydroxylase alpha subunit Fe(2+) 2OG dioxygenase domain-containing protein n=1 Tax=Branchiostoma floridae TaxID=7739 RepID=C3XYA2_BRAFL|eukprot:XP_002610777.1 hypothetical protein BRAFLDRAFT_126315 [Branchiostoma floridae]
MANFPKLISLFFWVYAFNFVTSQMDSHVDPSAWPFDNPNTFGTAQEREEGTKESLLQKAKWTYSTTRDRKVAVFDDILSFKTTVAISNYVHTVGAWRFQNFDPHEGNYTGQKGNNMQWEATFDPEVFSSSRTGQSLTQLVTEMSGGTQGYKLYSVTANVVRRLDLIRMYHNAEESEKEFSASIYLNEVWRKNDYGELYFYDDDEEIFAAVKPRFGRTVVWDSSIDYLSRPPSINFKQGQIILNMAFTTNSTKAENYKKMYDSVVAEREAARKAPFVTTEKPGIPNMDVQKHIIQEFYDSNDMKGVVLDNLFDEEDLSALRTFTIKYGQYFFDDSIDLDSDNVQWIAGFPVESYVKSKMWNITSQVVEHVSGKKGWYPYDVSCNLIRNADHTRIHEDCSPHEEEWTFLLYLNPNWTHNYHGETAFFEHNDDDTEYIAEVLPKFGRAVIFRGIIPHSARPPSVFFSGARYTFAVKMSVNQATAIRIQSLICLESLLRCVCYHGSGQLDDFEQKYKNMIIMMYREQRMVENALEKKQLGSLSIDDGEEGDEEEELGEEEEHGEEEEQDEVEQMFGGEEMELETFDDDDSEENPEEEQDRMLNKLFRAAGDNPQKLQAELDKFMEDFDKLKGQVRQELQKWF